MPSSRRSLGSSAALTVLLVVLAVAGAGCAAAATPTPSATAPVVSNAWVRPGTGMDVPAAGYMTITNPGGQPETLVAVSSPAASSVEMHQTTTMSGMTGMAQVSAIHIPAGGTVTLQPGSFHLMLMGAQALKVGDSIDLVLTFEKAGKITVKAEVKNG